MIKLDGIRIGLYGFQYPVPGIQFQPCRIQGYRGNRDTGIQGYRDTGIQGNRGYSGIAKIVSIKKIAQGRGMNQMQFVIDPLIIT